MKLSTLKKLVFDKGILSFLSLGAQTQTLYRSAFASAADSAGLLSLLSGGPKDAASIAHALRVRTEGQSALGAWLDCGVRIGELTLRQGRYELRGKLSRRLAKPRNQVTSALFAEVARYHFDAILQAPARIRDGRAYTLADQDGALIARSSRILEPFVEEAIDWALEQAPVHRVLEVGCGAGHYLSYLWRRQPGLELHAIDMQADVVASAREHLSQQGLDAQVRLQHIDLFELQLRPGEIGYDLITLHNNIYYFSDERRAALLSHVARLLAPQGRLLLTSSCRGGSPAIAALHLWWSLSEVRAGLPDKDALCQELLDAGWTNLQSRRLLPGESYFGFIARRPETLTHRI